jgi:L-fuconolactonase
VPLDRPDRAERLLERFCRRAKFVGVRHLIHEEPDPTWLLREPVIEGLRLLAAWRVPFDVVAAYPRHLALVPRVAERVPELRMVIDHLAKPPIRQGLFEPWATELAEAARSPTVYAKVSGLITEAAETWTVADLAPYVDHALTVFGPRRLMFGSDWPVLLVAGSYERVVAATERLLTSLNPDDQAWIFGRTAAAFYGLNGVGRVAEGQSLS